MKIRFEKTFAKDVDKIRDKSVLKKLRVVISTIESTDLVQNIPNLKKIEGYTSFFRVKLGDYRLGLQMSRKEVVFVRILHRKDIYRHFPKKD